MMPFPSRDLHFSIVSQPNPALVTAVRAGGQVPQTHRYSRPDLDARSRSQPTGLRAASPPIEPGFRAAEGLQRPPLKPGR